MIFLLKIQFNSIFQAFRDLYNHHTQTLQIHFLNFYTLSCWCTEIITKITTGAKHLAKVQYFTNLDFPEIAGVPFPGTEKLPKLGAKSVVFSTPRPSTQSCYFQMCLDRKLNFLLMMEEILHQMSSVAYHMIYRVFLYIPGGDSRRISEPSTVWWRDFFPTNLDAGEKSEPKIFSQMVGSNGDLPW